jgi:hypothetical protein
MPDGVIAAVEAMAKAEQQPLLSNGGPVFEWSPGIVIIDEDDEPNAFMDEPTEGDLLGTIGENEEEKDDNIIVDDVTSDVEDADTVSHGDFGDTGGSEAEEAEEAGEAEEDEEDEEDKEDKEDQDGEDNSDESTGSTDDATGEPSMEDVVTEETGNRYNLRPTRTRTYENPFAHSYDAQFLQHGIMSEVLHLQEAVEELKNHGSRTKAMKCIAGFIMTQMESRNTDKLPLTLCIRNFYGCTIWDSRRNRKERPYERSA